MCSHARSCGGVAGTDWKKCCEKRCEINGEMRGNLRKEGEGLNRSSPSVYAGMIIFMGFSCYHNISLANRCLRLRGDLSVTGFMNNCASLKLTALVRSDYLAETSHRRSVEPSAYEFIRDAARHCKHLSVLWVAEPRRFCSANHVELVITVGLDRLTLALLC